MTTTAATTVHALAALYLKAAEESGAETDVFYLHSEEEANADKYLVDQFESGLSKLSIHKIDRWADHAVSLTKRIEKDIKAVVAFDSENADFEGAGVSKEQKIPYFLFMHGGDWEMPVYFAIYHDGKELRAYIPTNGNYWNDTTKMAYGNHHEDWHESEFNANIMEDDNTNAKRRFNTDFESLTHSDADMSALREDVENFLDTALGATKSKNVKSSGKITTEDCVEVLNSLAGDLVNVKWKREYKATHPTTHEVMRTFVSKTDPRLQATVVELNGQIQTILINKIKVSNP